MSEMDGVIQEFLVESYENLDQLDRDFIVLEKSPDDRDKLASIFRTIHTIKGTCGFLGFGKLEKVAHSGENLLGLLRDGKLRLSTEITSALLAMVDAVRALLAQIEKTNAEGDGDYSALISTLDALQSSGGAPADKPAAAPATIAAAAASAAPAANDAKQTSAADSSIRVDVGVLDRLMNLVGELVLARNQILQFNAARRDSLDASFTYTTQRLNLITTELQEGVMKTRMQPIKNIWQKFPRVVRDLAMACGKRVRIEMEGEDTELDKTLIEAIKDPLTHLVRNSVDHGLERPEVRTTAGKSAEGRLLLRAYHEGGQVNIEITDDGGGIKLDAVKKKAIQNGLINAAQADRMGEREALNLIFLPGFSTAEKVTNVSGRGVGMDVVKTNVEKIGGTIDIQSVAGRGTTVKMKIPLTLAIIPALIVNSGPDRFAIPQVSLLELVRLEPEEVRKSIEMIHSTPVYRLRGKLLPLVSLSNELGLNERGQQTEQPSGEVINIVVLQADQHQFGLIVDGISDTQEIVVKPLANAFKGIEVYAGATIMGDGKVALILDVQGLARTAGMTAAAQSLSREAGDAAASVADEQMLLLCELRDGGRLAVPLNAIARLEVIAASSVETIGGQEVVQYRGEIMPLVDVLAVLPERRKSPRKPRANDTQTAQHHSVLVHQAGGRTIGLLVASILDVCSVSLQELKPPNRPGVRGTLALQGRVTELLDVTGLIDLVAPAQDAERMPVAVGSC